MTRGESTQMRVHFKGKEDDFLVYIDDLSTYKNWKTDKSVAMAHFMSSFKVFVTHKQGVQGTLDTASHALLDNEFGTHVDEEVIKQILEKGTVQESTMPERQGSKNDSHGSMAAH
jgi:ribosome maturation protein Sdo1